MSMIRLGVVGHGDRTSGVIKVCLRQVTPDIRVMGIVDPDEKGARDRLDECDKKNAVFYPNLKEMVSNARLDALMIGTRCNLHTPYAIEAAQYELPLYLEKPVAISMEQAIDLERAYQNAKCPVVVSFPLRLSPLCELTRQYIEDNAIGSCEHILAQNYVNYGICYWQMGYRNFDITQGLFLQKATHDLDYMSYLVGANIVRVAAMQTQRHVFGGNKPAGLTCDKCDETDTCLESPVNRRRNSSAPWDWALRDHPCLFSADCGSVETGTNEDSSSTLLEFDSGIHGVYTQVFYSRRDAARRGATISGYHGTLSFDWYDNELKHVRHHRPFTSTIKAGEGLEHFGGDGELARDFIDIITGKGRSRTTIEMGIQSAYACLAAKQSAETGQFVKVRQVGQVS